LKHAILPPEVPGEGRIRGMAIIHAASIEEARKIVNEDRMVETRRLVAEIHPVMIGDLSGLHVEYPTKRAKVES
jgi:hypothetical protein